MLRVTGGDVYVIRFAPFTSQGLARNARTTALDDSANSRSQRWGVSMFYCHSGSIEHLDEAIRAVCADAPVTGKRIEVVRLDVLEDAGFVVYDDQPPPAHCLVGEGNLESSPDVESLAAVMDVGRRDNPAWEG